MTLASDRNLLWQLESVNALIGVGNNNPIARPEIPILAKPVRVHEKAVRARVEVCFPTIGGRCFFRFALKTHVLGKCHIDVKRPDFEFKLVA